MKSHFCQRKIWFLIFILWKMCVHVSVSFKLLFALRVWTFNEQLFSLSIVCIWSYKAFLFELLKWMLCSCYLSFYSGLKWMFCYHFNAVINIFYYCYCCSSVDWLQLIFHKLNSLYFWLQNETNPHDFNDIMHWIFANNFFNHRLRNVRLFELVYLHCVCVCFFLYIFSSFYFFLMRRNIFYSNILQVNFNCGMTHFIV